jgi:uncharacterized coiled-coil DUF342 family protein
MEYIAKLQAQLDAAKQKEAEKAAKKAEVEAERKAKKRDAVTKRIARLTEQQEKVAAMLTEAHAELEELDDETPSFAQVTLDVVSNDDDADTSDIAV